MKRDANLYADVPPPPADFFEMLDWLEESMPRDAARESLTDLFGVTMGYLLGRLHTGLPGSDQQLQYYDLTRTIQLKLAVGDEDWVQAMNRHFGDEKLAFHEFFRMLREYRTGVVPAELR